MNEYVGKDNELKARESEFGVFIPTHGRADSQVTMNMLLDSGFTGDIWLVCDNLDESLDEYISRYGDRVLVFDKREWALKSDRITNQMELGTVLYARNYIQEVAYQMGYEVIGVFDDDLESFSVRFERDNSLHGVPIEDSMDELINMVGRYMLDARVSAMALAHNGGYFGGLEGDFKKGLTRNPAGAWFINLTEDGWGGWYRGIVDEDFNYNLDLGRTGKIAFKWMDVMFTTPERGTNEGGNKGMYDDMSDYAKSSYTLINAPNSTTLTENGSRRMNWKSIYSQIISERWRKDA